MGGGEGVAGVGEGDVVNGGHSCDRRHGDGAAVRRSDGGAEMSRMTRDSLAGGTSIAAGSSLLLQQQRRRMRSLAGGGGAKGEGGDEVLDLFSRNRRSISIAAGEESDGQNGTGLHLGRISVGPAKLMRSGMDDLLSAAEIGKHDYDWLLTPPGTPLISTLDGGEAQLPSVAPRSNSSVRSSSAAKTSRFSVPQPENKHPTRPARSSSVTRPSITTYSTSQVSSISSRTSLLNTSTASVTSSRPSTPGTRSTSLSSTRQSTPASSRPTPSRSSTPAKTRAADPSSVGDKPRPSHGSRPSTPTPRPQTPATATSSNPSSVASVAARSTSRSSTPTRRAALQSSAPAATRSSSVGRSTATPSSRTPGPASRPSSPVPRVRSPSQPVVPPDFPLHVPPNLRTKVPERPASAGRTRPGLALTARSNPNAEAAVPTNPSRRPSVSPVVTRGRLPENSPKLRLQSNGHQPCPPETQKPMLREIAASKPVKTTATTESTGFGRTISKKSLDMALRHMDIRQSLGGVRGASLFPQSIRSTSAKIMPARVSDPKVPSLSNGTETEDSSCNGTIYTGCNGAAFENGDVDLKSPGRDVPARRATEPDIYESSRYEAILLEEDARNMNWLRSIEDKSDQSPVFDLRFESLPEPFVLL